ncbi:AMIN domain-containing protein [Planktothricoides raciborskii]|uniref:AMIN domain-containing protein n=1 Tax=Planktothricoides raciborskii GIHE-MW2 TaxID=2792601 RepID=A0AAU8JDK5_9CYAN
MKPNYLLGVILGSSMVASLGAIALVQPAWAQATAITNVEVISSGGGIQLVLETSGGEAPQVFTINRGNDVVADLVNTTLNLKEGGSFRQNNPAPGIASIVVTPLDSNSVRVIVSGNGSAPNVDIAERSPNRITINYGTGIAGAPVNPPPPGNNPPPMAQEQPRPISQQPQQPQSEPEVLVPNPEITINGVPVPSTGTSQAPPFLPRAVAPPVGDIAISNTDSSPNLITLGSSEMIQSLVFKDTPVREALSVVARLAGVNVAYAAAGNTTNAQEVGELTINLDIENESLENVFNYILQLSGLEANRVGNTVFVGVNLPDSARDMVARTIRVNQITARDAGIYLASLGAETAVSSTQPQTQTVAIPIAGTDQFRQETTTSLKTVIETLTIEPDYLNPLLRGLQVVIDERANSLTISGPRRLVEMASAQLVALDVRKRQVAVNVKIIDVNLNNEDTFNTSFSFGINDSFFVSDNGAAAINFGGINPPTENTITTRRDGGLNLVPPVVVSPYGPNATQVGSLSVNPFSDTSQVRVPLTAPGQEGGSFLRPIAPLVNEVNGLFQPGISGYTSFSLDPGDTTLESLALGEATFALPTLFEYPTKFLALLQAQVVSRNAKILTDPTVVIQEGQNASVGLTEEVVGNIERETEFGDGFSRTTTTAEIKEAGLQLGITVDRIDDNGFVTMRIIPNVRSIAGTQTFGDTEITLLAERSLDSGTIRLRDGQTLILSGIIQEQERSTVTKWPILGDLPIIGSLFRGSTTQNQRAEVIVLVTPQILDDSDRSGFGYGYVPGQDAQEMMNRSR